MSTFNPRPAAPSAEKAALLHRCDALHRQKLITTK